MPNRVDDTHHAPPVGLDVDDADSSIGEVKALEAGPIVITRAPELVFDADVRGSPTLEQQHAQEP